MKCIVSRPSAEGRRRRYRRDDGTTLDTIEVPLSVWRAINRQGRGNDRAAAYAREIERRRVRHCAVALVDAGWKIIAVAHELKIPVRTIQRWKKEGLT